MTALEQVREAYSGLSDAAAIALMTLCLYGSLSREEIEENSGLTVKRAAAAVNELRLAKLIEAEEGGPIKDIWRISGDLAEVVKSVCSIYAGAKPKGYKRDAEIAAPKLGLKKKAEPQVEVKSKQQIMVEKCLSVAEIADKDQAVPMNSKEFLLGRYYLGLMRHMNLTKEELFEYVVGRVLSDNRDLQIIIDKYGSANALTLLDLSFSDRKSQIDWIDKDNLLNVLAQNKFAMKVKSALSNTGKEYKHDEQSSWANDYKEMKSTRC